MILKKIKTNYLNKIFEDLVKNDDFSSIIKELDKLKKDNQELYNLFLSRILNTYFKSDKGQYFFQNKIIWLNSFELSDATIIRDFLLFYLKEKGNLNIFPTTYVEALNNLSDKHQNKKINFQELVENSFFYQYEILQSDESKNKLILNNHVFFEKLPDKFFTHYYLTQCFFYVVRNPIHLYAKYRQNYNQVAALNMICGLDEEIINENQSTYNLVENTTKSWATNVLSWTNQNVMNTFRGLIIKYENLMEDPVQSFAEVISHLIQSGMEIDVDYDLIEIYINEHKEKFSGDLEFSEDISNQEKKKLSREFGEIIEKFHYKF